MPSELHKKAIARITPEERQEMIAKLRGISFGRWMNRMECKSTDIYDVWKKPDENGNYEFYTTDELYEQYDNDTESKPY